MIWRSDGSAPVPSWGNRTTSWFHVTSPRLSSSLPTVALYTKTSAGPMVQGWSTGRSSPPHRAFLQPEHNRLPAWECVALAVGRQRGADSGAMIQIVIRPKPSYKVPPCTAKLRFQNPPRRQACRPSRRRVHPFRAGHQPEGGKGARPQHPNCHARSRRRGDRVELLLTYLIAGAHGR
jgi:hypothetical protein